ncbi:hypothetical protein C4D60_Mb09t05420 [Musa balbisiana]|uniref:MHD1 domain-containing protein n=1 Tax=Musa balbisiana TaxID=52838 RepID=A0A4S8IGM0_MUSBA|nr:hypothetical protein C4D60_Mb09t05420 [Musa balbisiana]
MPRYEVDSGIANLVKVWIKKRAHKLKEYVDQNLQQEDWNRRANRESCASSAIEVLLIIDETLDAFFQLPIQMQKAMLSDLIKEKREATGHAKMKSQVGSTNGDGYYGLSQLCIRIILRLCETPAYKVIFHDLNHVLWDALYIGDTASCGIDPFIKELDPAAMEMISNTVRRWPISSILLPRFRLMALVCPQELVEKASSQVKIVLRLFYAETESLIEQFKDHPLG